MGPGNTCRDDTAKMAGEDLSHAQCVNAAGPDPKDHSQTKPEPGSDAIRADKAPEARARRPSGYSLAAASSSSAREKNTLGRRRWKCLSSLARNSVEAITLRCIAILR